MSERTIEVIKADLEAARTRRRELDGTIADLDRELRAAHGAAAGIAIGDIVLGTGKAAGWASKAEPAGREYKVAGISESYRHDGKPSIHAFAKLKSGEFGKQQKYIGADWTLKP